MGQREGRQGQSYAIHFLVTPVGCGGGCCNVWEIAPMFLAASKLPNVSLPKEFWIELDKGHGG